MKSGEVSGRRVVVIAFRDVPAKGRASALGGRNRGPTARRAALSISRGRARRRATTAFKRPTISRVLARYRVVRHRLRPTSSRVLVSGRRRQVAACTTGGRLMPRVRLHLCRVCG